jgi:hypothetical protein
MQSPCQLKDIPTFAPTYASDRQNQQGRSYNRTTFKNRNYTTASLGHHRAADTTLLTLGQVAGPKTIQFSMIVSIMPGPLEAALHLMKRLR